MLVWQDDNVEKMQTIIHTHALQNSLRINNDLAAVAAGNRIFVISLMKAIQNSEKIWVKPMKINQ